VEQRSRARRRCGVAAKGSSWMVERRRKRGGTVTQRGGERGQ
jgi:hypothetical protein